MHVQRVILTAFLTLILPLYGCQVLVASVTSPSEWVSGTGRSIAGIFEGLSTSSGSGGGAKQESYRRDLRQYAAAFVQSGGTQADFLRGVTRIAENHGVAHWEAEPATPYAIGQGMREGHVSERDMRAFCDEVGAETPAAKLAYEGWQSAGG
jgi:hypothetical protein